MPASLLHRDASKDWTYTLQSAKQDAIAGRYEDSDRELAAFIDRHPGRPEALEATYWRAVFLIDPANQHGSVTGAIAAFDRYLAGPPELPHWREAVTMRRVAAQLETATRLAVAASSTETANVRAPADEHAQEIARLRADLARANDELDRIKRRLTAPKP